MHKTFRNQANKQLHIKSDKDWVQIILESLRRVWQYKCFKDKPVEMTYF